MKTEFPGHYPQVTPEVVPLEKTVFVLDTSFLLNLYRLPGQAKASLLGILEKLSSRVWIPFHVALEYHRNLQTVVDDQASKFQCVRSIVEKGTTSIVSEIEKLKLRKRHSTIDPSNFILELNGVKERFLTHLQSLERDFNPQDSNQLREQIASILDGKVGVAPQAQKELDEIYKLGATRYSCKFPPGYMDSKKAGITSYLHRNLVYKPEYGDLIIWLQLLDYARKSDVAKLVLVTEDLKEDWLDLNHKYMGELVPRIELVEELASAGPKEFLILDSERFYRFSAERLGIQIDENAASQIHDLAYLYREAKETSDTELRKRATEAVLDWVSTRYGKATQGADGVMVPLSSDDLDEFDGMIFVVKVLDRIWSSTELFNFVCAAGERMGYNATVVVLCFENRNQAELVAEYLPSWFYNVVCDSTGNLFLVAYIGESGLVVYDVVDVEKWLMTKFGLHPLPHQ